MYNCEFKAFDGKETWFSGYVKETNKGFAVDMFDGKKIAFTVRVPSELYPLQKQNGEMFCYTNTHLITKETHPEIIEIFDSVKYNMGMGYHNAEELASKLVNAGYDAEEYVGWLFAGAGYPIHHAWVVLHIDGKDAILDLSSNVYQQLEYCTKNGLNMYTKDIDEARQALTKSFVELSKLPNSERCYPLGVPTPLYLYVGCPSTAQQGIDLFNMLRRKYPNHESSCISKIDEEGYTKTQRMINEELK